MTIRTLTPADAQAYRVFRLAALQEKPPAFSILYEKEENLPIETIASRLQESQDHYLLGAFVENDLVGIIRFSRSEEENEHHRALIASFYVHPNFRRQGIGKELLAQVLTRAHSNADLRRIHGIVNLMG